MPRPVLRNEGNRVTDWIDRTGRVERSSTPVLVRKATYIDETGVHLPDVFAELFERPEFREDRWIDLFGLPISEPFWTDFRRKGEPEPSLVQVFERRILVYSPLVEESYRFTVASSGRHYAQWRYGQDIQQPAVEFNQSEIAYDDDLTVADDLNAFVYAEDIGTPIDMTLSATGHLMILTVEGQILIARSQDPDAVPERFDVWVDGIEDPQGMVTRGDSVLVTAANRIWWYHDQNGSGVLDDIEALQADRSGSGSSQIVRGKPVISSSGDVFTRVEEGSADLTLRALASDETLLTLTDVVRRPGPTRFAREDLLLAGRNADDVPMVMMFPSVFSGPADDLPDPERIATFSPDSSVRAIAIMDHEIWSLQDYGDVYIALTDDDDGRVFALSTQHGAGETEILEIVRGLSRPTALEVGLDGSLYIADAETGRIIRLQASS
jgi:hypothetical protein